MDTKANLLYKQGRIKEAIKLEELALIRDPDNALIRETLAKMKKSLPTWPSIETLNSGKENADQ